MKKLPGRGFTLIELIMVIAIIGILTTIGLAEMRGVKELARDAVRTSDLSQIRLALALYYNNFNRYPATVGNIFNTSTSLVSGTIFSKVNNPLYPGYLSRVFVDPVNSETRGYWYYYDTNGAKGHRDYVFCFHKEGGSHRWFYIYALGLSGEADVCPALPKS